MSKCRELLHGKYNGKSFELYHTAGGHACLYTVIHPGSLIRVGGSPEGYLARPCMYAENYALSLVTIEPFEMALTFDQIAARAAKRKGQILRPGLCLWALTPGAARRGVQHHYTPPIDEIEQTLDDLGLGRKILYRVKHDQTCAYRREQVLFNHRIATDGVVEQTPSSTRDNGSEGEDYEPGTEFGAAYVTYFIHWINGQVADISVSKDVNSKLVAELIRRGPDADPREIVKELANSK